MPDQPTTATDVDDTEAEPGKSLSVTWVFDHDGLRFTELDFTLDECEKLDTEVGSRWVASTPTASPTHARAWIAAAFKRLGVKDFAHRASHMTFGQMVEAFRTVNDDELGEFRAADANGDRPT